MTPDLIKRFTPTPYKATLAVDNLVIRVSSNHPLVLDRLGSEFCVAKHRISDKAGASWRIVVEENGGVPIDLPVRVFSHDGLVFLRIGSRGFLALDRGAQAGISFVAQELVEDPRLFADCYLPAFLWMTQEMEASR
jgi:hypothetical protein